VDSDTQITTHVPAGATTGGLSVTVPDIGTAAGGTFTVQNVLVNEVETDASGFIELYNPGSSTVDLGGAKLFFRPAGATDSSTDVQLDLITNGQTVGSHQFFVFTLPTLNTTGGGIALELNGVIVDSMGYGTATNAWVHGSAAAAPGAGASVGRGPDGQDSGNDSLDFVVSTPSLGAPNNGA
jgi:hypothetical protein